MLKKTNHGKATLIDFERAHDSISPQNVSQFVQFLGHGKMARTLGRPNQALRELTRKYKGAIVKYLCDKDETGLNICFDGIRKTISNS